MVMTEDLLTTFNISLVVRVARRALAAGAPTPTAASCLLQLQLACRAACMRSALHWNCVLHLRCSSSASSVRARACTGDGHRARDVAGRGQRGAAVRRAAGQGHLQVSWLLLPCVLLQAQQAVVFW